jgi:RNA polymerase sigma-70 factor (ECF subfamily)
MTASEHEGLERELRASFDRGDLIATATEVIRAYGPELYRFLFSMTRDGSVADDLFSSTCERIWRGLPSFRWESPCRAWTYAIARHCFHHWTRERDRQRRQVALSVAPLSQLVAQVRSTTAAHLRAEVKDGFAAIRATLDPDDQILLHLRVDANLPWRDLAAALGEEGAVPTAREVAALRKRYERLKRELQALARKHHLMP